MKYFSKNSKLLEPVQHVEVFHTSKNLDTVVKVTDVEGTEARFHVEYYITTNNHEQENREKPV